MKKFMNAVDTMLAESLDGFAAAHTDLVALGDERNALPTHYAFAWADLLTADVDGTEMARGVLSGLIWATAFGATAVWWFRRKDIVS